MFDDSGISLSASDPNPTIDQWDDGGSSADFSSTLSAVTQLGTEIASMVTGQPAVSASGVPVGYGASGIISKPPMASTTKLLIVGAVIAVIVVAVHVYSN